MQKEGHTGAALQYCEDVVSGRKVVCKWVREACERQLRDLERQSEPDWPYQFDERRAARICNFIECLPHIKGKWGGTLIRLEPWQKFILTTAFGWVSKEEPNRRRFRTVYLELPRKSAKSTLSSGVALYMLLADEEEGAEVYSAATTRDQAKIVFNDAQAMVRKTFDLREHYGVEVGAHCIHVLETSSKFEALSADAHTLDGLNIHCAVIDELHAHKTRAVWDVIETAMGARSSPLLWAITTAGSDRSGICYEQRTYVTKILDRVAHDETYMGVIYTIDDGDDWEQESIWKKANPNYGVSVYPDDIARLVAKAMQMASAIGNLLTKRFCVWVSSDSSWMDMRAWDRCANPDLTIDDFADCPCWIALDLATKTDIAAMSILFRKMEFNNVGVSTANYYVFSRFYVPQETIDNSSNSQYSGWERTGRLIATPGAVTDFAVIESDVLGFCGRLKVEQVIKDPWQSAYIGTRLQDQGLTVVDVRQTVQGLSAPMKELEGLVLSGRLHHDGDPVLGWMASNVVAHLDVKENIYPRKDRPENKIDGVVSLIMALSQAVLGGKPTSVYESRGLFSV